MKIAETQNNHGEITRGSQYLENKILITRYCSVAKGLCKVRIIPKVKNG